MNVLVTGGCGFIGSNFIRHLLGRADGAPLPDRQPRQADLRRQPGQPGRRRRRQPATSSSTGTSATRRSCGGLLSENAHRGRRQFRGGEPRRPLDRLARAVRADERRRHAAAPERRQAPLVRPGEARRRAGSASCTSPPTRSTAPSRPSDPGFTEETPFAPNSPYAASKAASDHLVRAYQPHLRPSDARHQLLEQLRAVPFPGEAVPARDPERARRQAASRSTATAGRCATGSTSRTTAARSRSCWPRGRPGETYNVGGLNERTNLEAVQPHLLAPGRARAPRRTGRRIPRRSTFVADRPGHDRRYAIDCSKLQRELGWKPLESFETGLAKTVDWYLANRPWCDEITSKRYARESLGKSA